MVCAFLQPIQCVESHGIAPSRPTHVSLLGCHDLRRLSHSGASTSGRTATPPRKVACIRSPTILVCAAPDIEAPAATASTGGANPSLKEFDLVAFSNLCVDIVVHREKLPPADEPSRRELLSQLTGNPPPTSSWEVGGNTNTLIAASRLGLRVASVGHIGQDVYGNFLANVLHHEGIKLIEPVATGDLTPEQNATLLCFVLVTPDSQHSFCSRYDFGPWPLLSFVDSLTPGVEKVLDSTAALFINGFVFDEVPAEIVQRAAQRAKHAGAAVFFDPGPRSWTFNDNGPRRAALDAILDAADVILMTEEEAAAVTGCAHAEDAARNILDRPGTSTEWCIIKRGAEGALLAARSPDGALYEQRALKVDVRDTVGCGDSFASAVVLGYTRQHSIPAVMALASAVGAATAMGSGAGRNVARAEVVESLLRDAANECEDGRHSTALDLLRQSIKMDY